jgi:tetratricopeptide (TPR) repeat protein
MTTFTPWPGAHRCVRGVLLRNSMTAAAVTSTALRKIMKPFRFDELPQGWKPILPWAVLFISLLPSRTIKAVEFSREAANAMAKGDYDRAIEAYSAAISRSPRDANGYIGRGVAWRASGERRMAAEVEDCHDLARRDFDNAISDLTKAIRLDPKLAVAFRQRGELYNYIHDYKRALADLGDAIRLDSHDADAYVQWSLWPAAINLQHWS